MLFHSTPDLETPANSQVLNCYPSQKLFQMHPSSNKKSVVENVAFCPFTSNQNMLESIGSLKKADMALSKVRLPKLDARIKYRFHKESTFGIQKPGILADLQRAKKERLKRLAAGQNIFDKIPSQCHRKNSGE